MTKIIDIKKEALKYYEKFLSGTVENDSPVMFPFEIRYSKPQLSEDRSTIKEKVDYLEKNSKSKLGWGYEIEWESKSSRTWSEVNIPIKVYFSDETNFLKFIEKEKEHSEFRDNLKLITSQIPELAKWIKDNPLDVVKNSTKWTELLRVCLYFKSEHLPNKYYLRELPVSVDTKFIENNSSILRSLLDFLIPEKINVSNYFNERYSIKNKEKLIRIRILCDQIATEFNYSDFSIKLSDFISREIPSKNIVIAENELNFLTLPKKESTIAIWSGGGFQVSYIANVAWLKSKKIFYWGDIDAAGLTILSQIRTYYDSVKSILMDRATFEKFYDNGKTDKFISAKQLKGLTAEEIEFFNYLNENRLRLEQEKIPQLEIVELFKKIISEKHL
ncbi:MAG: hypothetical protein JNJ40_12620 [Bacteroidia bacterium]|nr:hypothetical protein [Bacteroidia bacterium]